MAFGANIRLYTASRLISLYEASTIYKYHSKIFTKEVIDKILFLHFQTCVCKQT